MTGAVTAAASSRRCAVRITGVVQGVGFRPFIHRLATSLGLTGFVGNDTAGVFVEVQGPPEAVAEFVERVPREAPALARVESVRVTAELEPGPESGFAIVASPAGSATAPTSLPPDTATCPDCLRELCDPGDRRFGYPFIACTNCGPRFTITTGLPYDRANTTMAAFELCPACRAEYEDPGSRRFHAQPTACWDCGPQLSLPVPQLAGLLLGGAIVAIKGIGGYHLACDAGNPEVVARLRARKNRGAKPFAVMARDLGVIRAHAHVNAAEESLLASPARPIVLLDATDPQLQESVAPGNNFVGMMLGYSPLHHLLFTELARQSGGGTGLLVLTSGNLSDEPIATTRADAEARLAGIADAFCHHDRHIAVACDDSVTRVVLGAGQPVRRSRGYAPLPVALPLPAPPMLAVGGEIKAAACLARGRHAWLSQHIGDTESMATVAMLAHSVEVLAQVQQVRPEVIASDAHPGYQSRRWAAARAAELGVEHLLVQHHHAHLASLLAEHEVPPDRQVLGVTFDGTGYGGDATIWGGELLLGSYESVVRVGHLSPVLLPGGDAAIRYPARVALAQLAAAGLPATGPAARAVGPGLALLSRMLATGSHCTPTTSAGRLFDAVASLLDVRHEVDYEGQAAIELEALARTWSGVAASWPGDVLERDGMVILDSRKWIERAVADQAAGVPVAAAAHGFHLGLAGSVVRAANLLREGYGVTTVGLTGGVFANALLTAQCDRLLRDAGFEVLTHRLVPPNDGGLALGQVAVVAAGGAAAPQGSTGLQTHL